MTTRAVLVPRDSGSGPALRFERVELIAHYALGLLVLAFGQLLPNLGSVFVVMLGMFTIGYAVVLQRLWSRAETPAEVDWVNRVTFAADMSITSFALLVFSPDPMWTIYAAGFLVIATGGLRFREGALLAAASLSLTYLVIAGFRTLQLGMTFLTAQMVLQLAGYGLAAAIFNRVIPELESLRKREHELYEPLLEAQEATGEAFLVTENRRPIFWNTALQKMTGYDAAGLDRFAALDQLVTPDSASLAEAFAENEDESSSFDGHLYRKDGSRLDVGVLRRPVRTTDGLRHIWILRDVTAQHVNERSLREQALHDRLTGLPNRTLLEDRLQGALLKAQRHSTAVTVLLLDLDGFKRVNDVFGHRAGDAVLVEVAKRLSGALRATDTVARLGGDEFVVVLPDTSLVGAELTGTSLLKAIATPIEFEEKHLEVGTSVGIASHPGHGDDPETLLRNADLAMYAAKREGGGCAIFTPALASADRPR